MPKDDHLNWKAASRLGFLERRLFWEGRINRADLMTRFGVSQNQASADFTRYHELAPANLVYDKSRKTYLAAQAFAPAFGAPDADRYLAELRLLGDQIVAPGEGDLGELPPFALALTPRRGVPAPILRAVLEAIRERRALSVHYQSMSHPAPRQRSIEPHALAFDGFRWHARARDRAVDAFKDFVLARMSDARVEAEAALSCQDDDAAWNTWVALVIAPHPELTPGQAAAICADYEIEGGSRSVSVRRALLWYTLRRLGLDTDPAARPAHEQHIVLVNRDEVLAT